MSQPRVAVCSLFRDDTPAYIDAYFARASQLTGADFRFYLAEGDSVSSECYDVLKAVAHNREDVWVTKADSGMPKLGSVAHPKRFKALAVPANAIFEQVVSDEWADYVLWLESDLLYQPDMVAKLLEYDKAIVSPMIWKDGRDFRFYDIWAYRYLNGNKFSPAFRAWYQANVEDMELYSTGSVMLMQAKYFYEGVRMPEKNVVIGICEQVRERGGEVWLASSIDVIHP